MILRPHSSFSEFLFGVLCITLVESGVNPRTKRKFAEEPPPPRNNTFTEAAWTLIFLLTVLIAPMLIHFIYVIATDPATPFLVKDLVELLKERCFGFLSDLGVKVNRDKKA